MPNVKIFVDDSLYPGLREPLVQALGPIREMLCRDLSVTNPAVLWGICHTGV